MNTQKANTETDRIELKRLCEVHHRKILCQYAGERLEGHRAAQRHEPFDAWPLAARIAYLRDLARFWRLQSRYWLARGRRDCYRYAVTNLRQASAKLTQLQLPPCP